jgi:protein SCO1/2
MTLKRLAGMAVVLACAGTLIALSVGRPPAAHRARHRLAALEQTVLPMAAGEPLRASSLLATDGSVFTPGRLRGRWSVMVFGFTSCPDVCPTTLQALGAVARDPASGVSAGTTQLVFVTVDPEHDTPERVQRHLARFGGRILGLTGSRDALDRFKAEVGAASRAFGTGIDHSTSLFVLDPRGRVAGILLRPADPARIVADLDVLRRSEDAARHGSLAR